MVLERQAGAKRHSRGFWGAELALWVCPTRRSEPTAQPSGVSMFPDVSPCFLTLQSCSFHHFNFFLIPTRSPGIAKPHLKSPNVTSFSCGSHPAALTNARFITALPLLRDLLPRVHTSQGYLCEASTTKRDNGTDTSFKERPVQRREVRGWSPPRSAIGLAER